MSNWRQTWTAAVTKPSVKTYSAMALDPKANAWRPTIWILVAGLIAVILSFGADYLTHQVAYSFYSKTELLATIAGPRLFLGVFGSFFGFVILVSVQHLIAQRLGGRGTFAQQAYVVGAITAPLLILSAVVASLPVIFIITPLIILFGLVVEVTAIKAIYSFGWIKALLSSVVIWVVIVVILLTMVLVLLGPSIGKIFSEKFFPT